MGFGFNSAIDLIASNLGASPEALLLIVVFLAGLIFYALDMRIGIMIHFMLFSVSFVVLALLGMSTIYALTLTLLSLVVLSLSLYTSYSKTRSVV